MQWTLDRLLNLEYEVTRDGDGNLERLEVDPDYGVRSVETIEEDLKACIPWEKLERLFALRSQRTPMQVEAALAEFPWLEFHMGTEAFGRLFRAEWAEIVNSVYWGLRRFSDDLFSSVIASRIGLGGPAAARFEAEIQWRRPDNLPEWAARYAVREISRLLPDVVERLRSFQVTPVTSAVPTNVARYAREASRCYLYGFFSAALILCRSCIESGIEEKLYPKGLGKQLSAMGFNKVQAMLELALDSGVLDDLTFNGEPYPQECQSGRPWGYSGLGQTAGQKSNRRGLFFTNFTNRLDQIHVVPLSLSWSCKAAPLRISRSSSRQRPNLG